MTRICDKCSRPAVTFIRYNGTHLCNRHFIQYFDRRVKKDIKKQGKTRGNSKIGIAISGGKDSTVALYIAHSLFSRRKDVDLVGITVDEGIKGYRDKSINIATSNCEKLGVDHHVVSFEDEIGVTMDEISSLDNELGECTYCGVFRRLCLNKKSKKLGVDKLFTGHNLDDMSQSILMNFANGDMQKLARLGPHKKVQPGLVPRMFPLRVIPEKEVGLYAIIKNMEYHDGVCPYSTGAHRGVFRDIVDDLEYKNPGTRHSILSSYEGIKDLLLEKFPPVDLNNCLRCGEPTSQDICKACLLRDRIM